MLSGLEKWPSTLTLGTTVMTDCDNGQDHNDHTSRARVVNALLTQLDSLKSEPNVLILTTSNITGAIDLAFVDR